MGGLNRGSPSASREAERNELRVAVLGGDGVGPEVTASAMQVLEAAVRDQGVTLRLDARLVGWTAVLEEGSPLPDTTRRACVEADAVFWVPSGIRTQLDNPVSVFPKRDCWRCAKRSTAGRTSDPCVFRPRWSGSRHYAPSGCGAPT